MSLQVARPLNIVIVGLGYVGVTAAACLASQGHDVTGVDVSDQKVATINSGDSPIAEPGLSELISRAVQDGNLRATHSLPSLAATDIVIVCVGTPSAPDGSHNMSYVAESARQIALAVAQTPIERKVTVAFRSTFRPGTTEDLIAPIFSQPLGPGYRERVELVYNPEFLRESTAIADYFAPPKIVIGTQDAERSEVMELLHDGIDGPVFQVGLREAEITKFVDNSWHAVKVAFANEVGRICAANGVDARMAHKIFASDTKLNISTYYTRPGGAFGGSCLPKDVRAAQHIASTGGVKVELLESLIQSNESHKAFQLSRVTDAVKLGASILVVGLAFKAGTDDLRESPNVTLVAELIQRGYQVKVFDPVVQNSSLVGQNLGYVLTQIPDLTSRLVTRDEASEGMYDLIVANNATILELSEMSAPILDLQTIVPVDAGTRSR